MEEEEFRLKAAEAEQLAEKSKSLTARQRWRRIAQGWLAMLGRRSDRPTSHHRKDEPSPTPAENGQHPLGSG
jgi:hypothetical protein